MLKIKKDSVIYPYGAGGNSFTSESEISQPILEHLQTRFPDDIEEVGKKKPAPVEPVVEPVIPVVEPVIEPAPEPVAPDVPAPVEPVVVKVSKAATKK
jgi:hypothetical protein